MLKYSIYQILLKSISIENIEKSGHTRLFAATWLKYFMVGLFFTIFEIFDMFEI